MTKTLSTESANWVPPSNSTSFSSTLPNYEDSLPFRVNREGVKNYVKNRGSLNIGDWAIEGRQISKTTSPINQETNSLHPKVVGADAFRNYTNNIHSKPHLLDGNFQPPSSPYGLRVRKEGFANYEKNHKTQMKTLLENYGKLSVPAPPLPHTQGQIATNLFYSHQEGQMGPILNNYGDNLSTPRRIPHVKGNDAEMNRHKGHGDIQLLQHSIDYRRPTAEPHVKGDQAHLNYDIGQGRRVNELFHKYGQLHQSARGPPKVKFDGVENYTKGQGNAMLKTLSQCPPTDRHMQRPQSVPLRS